MFIQVISNIKSSFRDVKFYTVFGTKLYHRGYKRDDILPTLLQWCPKSNSKP